MKVSLTPTCSPEGGGLLAGVGFLVALFIYVPFHFDYHLQTGAPDASFPHAQVPTVYIHLGADMCQFVEFVSGLLSICCMLFLGFADDVLNLRWR